MANNYPVYSTKASQPGIADQLWDMQKYGRATISWIGQTTNATPQELAIDNFSWSLPASTSPATALFKRLLLPRDSIASINMYGAAFDTTADNNAGAGEGNAGFFAQFSVINISGQCAFAPAAAPTVTNKLTTGAGALVAAFSVGGAGTDAVILTVTGIAARTINWHIAADYVVARAQGSPSNGQFGI